MIFSKIFLPFTSFPEIERIQIQTNLIQNKKLPFLIIILMGVSGSVSQKARQSQSYIESRQSGECNTLPLDHQRRNVLLNQTIRGMVLGLKPFLKKKREMISSNI